MDFDTVKKVEQYQDYLAELHAQNECRDISDEQRVAEAEMFGDAIEIALVRVRYPQGAYDYDVKMWLRELPRFEEFIPFQGGSDV